MSVSPLSPISAKTSAGVTSLGNHGARPAVADKKQAAAQFEAIIIRQLLEPVLKPAMSSLGGAGGSGSEIYGYMLTDAMATQLSQGGGLGLANVLEKEFNGATHKQEPTSSTALRLRK
jgi:Rod binding domain-containing protein